MIAGKGWIALALTTFATWRPARVLLGAYLFGGVTMLQFYLQGEGVHVPSQFLSMLPYLATIVVLVLISRNADVDPGQHAGVARQAVLSGIVTSARHSHNRRRSRSIALSALGEHMTSQTKRSLLKLAAMTALAAAAALVGCGKKDEPAHRPPLRPPRPPRRAAARTTEDRVRLRRPGRRRRLDLRARQRTQGARKAIRRQDHHQLRRERARGGRRRARVPRHGGPGQQADLRHHVRLHGADDEGRCRRQGREDSNTPPATRRRRTCAPTTAAPTRAPTSPASSPAA